MAKEIKTLKVSAARETATIRTYQCFGWELLSNQEIYSKDSHLEKWGNTTYSVTETTHYVKLTFERTPEKLVNYQRIVQLENEYHALPAPPKKPFVFKWWGYLFIAPFALIFFAIGMGLGAVIPNLIAIAICAATYYIQRTGKAKMPNWQNTCNIYRAKQEEIMNAAYRLLKN